MPIELMEKLKLREVKHLPKQQGWKPSHPDALPSPGCWMALPVPNQHITCSQLSAQPQDSREHLHG